MKNVAKCDTWCELQNPVNHRVFERKLRPKPLGRGHVCLGVSQRVAPPPPYGFRRGRILAPRVPMRAASLKASTDDRRRGNWWLSNRFILSCALQSMSVYSTTLKRHSLGASIATPGQAGLPAEFKHINKRRKRN